MKDAQIWVLFPSGFMGAKAWRSNSSNIDLTESKTLSSSDTKLHGRKCLRTNPHLSLIRSTLCMQRLLHYLAIYWWRAGAERLLQPVSKVIFEKIQRSNLL